VPTDLLADVLAGPWSLAAMSLLVLGDAFFVVIPGEIAVTALGAVAVTTGRPRSGRWCSALPRRGESASGTGVRPDGWITGHRLSARLVPFTTSGQSAPVPTDLLADVLAGPWSLAAMSLLVLGDAFFVVI
ncbi:hypothetical protein CTI14_46615, partial [Methylobacterium radiotolerans]